MFALQGFPGNLNVTATYTLNDNNELRLAMEATTDKATPINLAQHSYFNLNGQARDTILNHLLQINGCAPLLQVYQICQIMAAMCKFLLLVSRGLGQLVLER